MRKFSLGKLLFGISLSLSSFALSSCSSFFATSQGYLIEEMTYTTDENGNTRITVTFDDKTVTPLEITIPRGVGIDHIDSSVNGDSTSVTLTIYYTDENLEPATITLPIVKGDDGRGVEHVSCTQNESGDYEIRFEMSDGSVEGPFPIKKGEDGRDIVNITAATNEETGYTTISVEFNDGTTEKFDVQLGKDGAGIQSIIPSELGDEYILNITFTDGTSTTVSFQKPQATKWYYGNTLPDPLIGVEGDFYIDSSTRTFYTKSSTGWVKIFSLNDEVTKTYEITFNVNGGSWERIQSGVPETDTRSFTFNANSFVNLDNNELKVKREGFVFNGWRTDAEITANSGHFTNLTPVSSNLTLYANWLEK